MIRGGIADVAKITGVPAGTIRRWLTEGRICRYGEGKPWRVDLDEVASLRVQLAQSRRVSNDRP